MFQHHERPAILGAICILVIMAGFDVWDDARQGESIDMLIWDVVLVGAVTGLLTYIFVFQPHAAHLRTRRLESEAMEQTAELNALAHQARKQLEGLGVYISAQFDTWKLTPAEKEVALLLLKGLSMKEIASVRGISERTARQQATTVYGKAELDGRTGLSAYFLEDLLLPGPPS